MPKAFSRHSERKDIFRKPRKGNVIGGVHKSGGLYLEGSRRTQMLLTRKRWKTEGGSDS